MPTSSKLEDAVTGQLRRDDINNLPAFREGEKLLRPIKDIRGRPNISARNRRPEWDGKTFKPRRTKLKVPYLLHSYDLKDETPDCAGTRVHLKVVARGKLAFRVSGFELAAAPVVLDTAEPHTHITRNDLVTPKRISKAFREKRSLNAPLLVIHNHRSLECEKRD